MAEIEKIYQNGEEFGFKKNEQPDINKLNIKSLTTRVSQMELGAFVANGYLSPLKLNSNTPSEGDRLSFDEITGKFDWRAPSSKIIIATGEELLPNMVIDPTFDTSTANWAGVNRAVTGGKGIVTVTGGSNSNINQAITYEEGSEYIVKVDVERTGGTTGTIRVMDNAGNTGGLTQTQTLTVLDGTVQSLEFRWTAQANSDKIQVNRAQNTGDYTFTVDNVTVQKVSSTSAGAPTSPTDTGEKGKIVSTTDHLYICIDTNTWIRFEKDTW